MKNTAAKESPKSLSLTNILTPHMENRQDYLLTQINEVGKAMRRLLEKLLNLPPEDDGGEELQGIMQAQIALNTEAPMVDTLNSIDDSDLITTLVETYGYTMENIKQLADVLYALSAKVTANGVFRRKSLILYRHYLQGSKKSIDFLVFGRVSELEQDEAAAARN